MQNWTHIETLIERVRNRFHESLGKSLIFETLSALFPQASPVYFNKKTGELIVQVESSALAQNLHFSANRITEEINKKLKTPLVRRIKFRVG